MEFSRSFQNLYRDCPIEELTRVIGNELSFNVYDRLPGKDAATKAQLLQQEFKALEEERQLRGKRIQPKDDIYKLQTNKRKRVKPELLTLDKKLFILSIAQLHPFRQRGLEKGDFDVLDISYKDVRAEIRNWLNEYMIDNEVSVIFKHGNKKKILVYNS